MFTSLLTLTVSGLKQFVQNSFVRNSSRDRDVVMTLPTETALTLVVVKSLAIVGSAFAAVLFLAAVGTKRR